MAPTQQEKVKTRLELWMLVLSLIGFLSAPAAAFLTFKVTVESEMRQSTVTLSDHEMRIRAIEEERSELARVLARLDQTASDLVKKVDRIESKLDSVK